MEVDKGRGGDTVVFGLTQIIPKAPRATGLLVV